MTQSPPPPAENEAPQAAPSAPAQAGSSGSDDRMLAMLCHLLGIFGFLIPLIIWLIKREDSPTVNENGKMSLNWQFTVLIGYFVSGVLTLVIVGFFLYIALVILNIVYCILNGVHANAGKPCKYPFSIKFLK